MDAWGNAMCMCETSGQGLDLQKNKGGEEMGGIYWTLISIKA